MSFSWREIQIAIERVEARRAVARQTAAELGDSKLARAHRRGLRLRRYAGRATALVVGFNVGLMSLIFNYILFNVILHVSTSWR